MQLTIDVDKHFIENLKRECHTTDIKDALYQLLDFYNRKCITVRHSQLDWESTNSI